MGVAVALTWVGVSSLVAGVVLAFGVAAGLMVAGVLLVLAGLSQEVD